MTDAKDPVCGMSMKEKNSNFTSSYKRVSYYFCSEKCKAEFDEDPESVLAMKTAREKATEKERSASLEKMMDQVTHEIRNPLTSLGGFVRRVYKRMPDDDPNKNDLMTVIEDVKRLDEVMKQLIDITITGMLHLESVNINEVIVEVLNKFDNEFKEHSIEVTTELDDNLLPSSIDREKLSTAIFKLIENSVEAMQIIPRVFKITTHATDGFIEIKISDTGKGIPEDKLKQIFDPFFTSKIYGPGLGLTLVKRIIHEHRGTISVDSKPGKGTIFTIRLPLQRS